MFLCSNLVSLLKLNLQHWVIQAREFEIVKETGFITATTTRRANIFKDHKNNLYALPRLPLIETPKEKMFFKMSLSGFLPAYLNTCKRVVTL